MIHLNIQCIAFLQALSACALRFFLLYFIILFGCFQCVFAFLYLFQQNQQTLRSNLVIFKCSIVSSFFFVCCWVPVFDTENRIVLINSRFMMWYFELHSDGSLVWNAMDFLDPSPRPIRPMLEIHSQNIKPDAHFWQYQKRSIAMKAMKTAFQHTTISSRFGCANSRCYKDPETDISAIHSLIWKLISVNR